MFHYKYLYINCKENSISERAIGNKIRNAVLFVNNCYHGIYYTKKKKPIIIDTRIIIDDIIGGRTSEGESSVLDCPTKVLDYLILLISTYLHTAAYTSL